MQNVYQTLNNGSRIPQMGFGVYLIEGDENKNLEKYATTDSPEYKKMVQMIADRFGLSLGFHALDQEGYLAIVRAYAEARNLPFDPADALRWAASRGARSGRVAWQYAVELTGREGRAV